MQFKTTEAIIFRNVLYQDKKNILTAYTLEEGLVTFLVNGLSSQRSHLFAICTPITKTMLSYSHSKSDFLLLKDGQVLSEYYDLKNTSWDNLSAAGELIKILSDTLLPKLPSPKLYHLLEATLNHLGKSTNPQVLLCHLLIKTLHLEGVLDLQGVCGCLQKATLLQGGVSLCNTCQTPYKNVDFEKEEHSILIALLQAKRFQALSPLFIPEPLEKKIKAYFRVALKN